MMILEAGKRAEAGEKGPEGASNLGVEGSQSVPRYPFARSDPLTMDDSRLTRR